MVVNHYAVRDFLRNTLCVGIGELTDFVTQKEDINASLPGKSFVLQTCERV